MIYLVPNNMLKNVHGYSLRNFIKRNISDIYDYTENLVFNGITIAPIMIMCIKKADIGKLVIHFRNKKNFIISKNQLGDKWIIKSYENTKQKNRFGDYFSVSNSIATLKNEIYILDGKIDKTPFIIDGLELEKKLIYNAVSPRTIRHNIKKVAIFPYKIVDNKIEHFDEEEILNSFPNIYKYLYNKINDLKARSTKSEKWYEYGRQQGLYSIFGEKLIIPMVLSNCISIYKAADFDLPFAGYYIKSKGDKSLEEAQSILMSDKFKKYIECLGTKTSETTYRISCKDIENFCY